MKLQVSNCLLLPNDTSSLQIKLPVMFGGPAGKQALPFPGSIWIDRRYYPLQRNLFWSGFLCDYSRTHHHCISVLTCSLNQQPSRLLAEKESIQKRLVITELRFRNVLSKSDHASFLFTPKLCCVSRNCAELKETFLRVRESLPKYQVFRIFQNFRH